MHKLGLAFASTSRQTTLRTLVRVLLYGHVVHVSSCSLVLVSRHERIATVGDFYTENANARLNWQIELIHHKTTFDNHGVHGLPHSPRSRYIQHNLPIKEHFVMLC
jgi:hypothetical protein